VQKDIGSTELYSEITSVLCAWHHPGSDCLFCRTQAGNFQLRLTKAEAIDDVKITPAVEGCVEPLTWSPEGQKILLGAAGLGADLAGCQGGARYALIPAFHLPVALRLV